MQYPPTHEVGALPFHHLCASKSQHAGFERLPITITFCRPITALPFSPYSQRYWQLELRACLSHDEDLFPMSLSFVLFLSLDFKIVTWCSLLVFFLSRCVLGSYVGLQSGWAVFIALEKKKRFRANSWTFPGIANESAWYRLAPVAWDEQNFTERML